MRTIALEPVSVISSRRLVAIEDAVGAPMRIGGPMRLGTARIDRWSLAQGPVTLPLHGADGIHLVVLLSGGLAQLPGHAALAPGGLLLTCGGSAHFAHAAAGTRLLSVTLPREVLHGVVELPEDAPLIISRSTALTRGIVAFLTQVAEGGPGELTGVDRYSLERFLQEMVTALALAQMRIPQAPLRRDVFEEAVAVIASCCTDPGLDVETVAAECNVSVRTLEREFRRQGTSIRSAIRQARVDHACSLLGSADYDPLGIDQIAEHSGFSNGSSLARAMRAVGLPSPAQVRRRR